MNTIQQRWENFRKNVNVPDATPEIEEALKYGFYAGCSELISLLMSLEELSEEAADAVFVGLAQEATLFFNPNADFSSLDDETH